MRRRRNCRSRRGVATLELILVTPILLIVLIFSVQVGIFSIYQATVVHSATVAAREAGKGADFLPSVVDTVNEVVGIHGIVISETSGSGTKVVLDAYGLGTPLEYGDATFDCDPPANAPEFDQVRVTVCAKLWATSFFDALAGWGLSFSDRTLRASSLVMKELEQDTAIVP